MKKKVLIIVGVIIAILIVAFVGSIIYDIREENKLNQEFFEINELVSEDEMDMDAVNERLERTVTTGDYGKLERAIKNYLSAILGSVNKMVELAEDERIINLLTADNYITDGPNFTESKQFIGQVRTSLEEENEKLKELFSEEKVMTYIDNENLDEYYIDLYQNEFAKEIDGIDYNSLVEVVVNDLISLLDISENVLDFLTNNASNWEIEGDTILFSNDELGNEYNGYINEIDALAETYESYNL